jgi:hypothetical protein
MFGRLKNWLSGSQKHNPSIRQNCPECGAAAGNMHDIFCLKERCPFCGGQLVTCGCIISVLRLNNDERQAYEEYEDDSVEPLLGINERWVSALEAKGRVPF